MQDRSLERQQRFAELVTLRVNSRANSEYRKNNNLEPGDFELHARHHTDNSRWFVFVAKHKGEIAWIADGHKELEGRIGLEASNTKRETSNSELKGDYFFRRTLLFAEECLASVRKKNKKSTYLWMHKLEPEDLTIEVRDGDAPSRYEIKHRGLHHKYLSSRAALKEHLRLD